MRACMPARTHARTPAGMGLIDALNSTTHNSQLADGTPSVCDTTTCHGYCIDYLECSTQDILMETDFVKTIFDWQNAVFLVFILIIAKTGRFVFRRLYQAHMAHETLKQSATNVIQVQPASTGFDAYLAGAETSEAERGACWMNRCAWVPQQ